jgi:DNA-binding NtrC family response regulator
MSTGNRVLIVGERHAPTASLAALLRGHGHDIATAQSEPREALVEAAGQADVLVVAAESCAERCLDVLARLRTAHADLPIILIGRGCQVETAVQALRLGMVDYLSRPVSPHKLREKVDDAVERRACLCELAKWRATQQVE